MEDLSRIEQVEQEIENIAYFIDGPTSFIYDHIEDPSQYEIVECLRAIIYSNKAYLTQKKKDIDMLRKKINVTTSNSLPTQSIQSTQSIPNVDSKEIPKTEKNLTDYIKLILFSDMNDEISKKLSSLSREDKIRLKLYFLKMANQTKKAIKESILRNPTLGISKLQSDLSIYELAISFVETIEKESEPESTFEATPSRIFVVPNNHNSTYLYEDILTYKENRKEIKNIIDKIIEGYFLKTKDIKSIESVKPNCLYEYKHPNGIRVLYVVYKGLIFICSLFYKDKQKSSRIDSYYEEAIRRFNSSKDYIINNNDNPDFYIEQDELLGQIYSLINDISYTKKVGE